MSKRAFCLALIVVVFCYCQYAYCKGSPDEIIIKGGGVSHTIEITDRATLKGFDPWSGQFIDWPRGIVAKPPTGGATYEVSFYIKWKPKDRHLRFFYLFRYIPGRNGEHGVVYLPDRSDEWGFVNPGTILRNGDDGHWHYASTSWDRLMERLILRGA
jgi:hypothetical protein